MDILFSLYRDFGKYDKVKLGNVTTVERKIPDHIQKPDYWKTGHPNLQLGARTIEIKKPESIDKMRNACLLARKVLNAAVKQVKVGHHRILNYS